MQIWRTLKAISWKGNAGLKKITSDMVLDTNEAKKLTEVVELCTQI